MGKKKKKTRPWRYPNPELARAMQGLRRSNAAGRHVPTPHKGTRRERKSRAINEQKEEL